MLIVHCYKLSLALGEEKEIKSLPSRNLQYSKSSNFNIERDANVEVHLTVCKCRGSSSPF